MIVLLVNDTLVFSSPLPAVCFHVSFRIPAVTASKSLKSVRIKATKLSKAIQVHRTCHYFWMHLSGFTLMLPFMCLFCLIWCTVWCLLILSFGSVFQLQFGFSLEGNQITSFWGMIIEIIQFLLLISIWFSSNWLLYSGFASVWNWFLLFSCRSH